MTFPPDLLVANGIILLMSVAIACAATRAGKTISVALAILAVGILLLHALWLGDNLILARMVPVADAIAWANFQTPAVALLAGVAWSRLRSPLWQRYLFVGVLGGIAFWRMMGPYIGSRPKLGTAHWANGVCKQSTSSTCSAAAAATLLSSAGIPASESEMADLCLTHKEGTFALGLYRGLKIKTSGTSWDVAVNTGPIDDMQKLRLPAIVNLSDPGVPSGIFGIGNRHSVVIFAVENPGQARIGDPFTDGIQLWTFAQLSKCAQPGALSLVRR